MATDNKVETPEGAVKHTGDPDKGVHTDAELAKQEGMWDDLTPEEQQRLLDSDPMDAEESETKETATEKVTEPTETPAGGEETASEKLARLEKEYENLQQRYSGSSEEGKRLARELARKEARERFLKERWNAEELFEGYEEQPTAEDRPITRRELQQMQEIDRWRGAEESFFTHPDNKDMTHPIMERTIKAMLFNDDGSLRYPDELPRKSFDLAAKEVRNFLAEQKQLGKQEQMTTRTEMEKAAITDATTPGPGTVTETEEDVIYEDEYARMWRKQQEQQANE